MYRYRNGRWVLVKTLAATNVDSGDFTKYRLRTRLTGKGRYRFRATATPMRMGLDHHELQPHPGGQVGRPAGRPEETSVQQPLKSRSGIVGAR